MVIPAHRVCVCVCACMSVWLAAHTSPSFLLLLLSIIPGIWQPKPVKKTFLLATVF